MTQTLFCLLLLAHPQADQDAEFRSRLAKTDPADGTALLSLGGWCEQQKRSSWAERCYRMVADLEAKEKNYPEAVYRLARIEIENKLYTRAYKRLRDLTSRFSHPAASALLKKAQTETSRRQRALVSEGDKLYRAAELADARLKYSEAFALLPENASSADFVPRTKVLERLAACADKIDDEHFKEIFQPKKRSIRACERCARHGGFLKCTTCLATGAQDATLRGKPIKVACRRCTGVGYTFCPDCKGMQYKTQSYKITAREQEALTRVLTQVREKKVLERPLAQAVKTVQKLVLNTREAATLDYFRAISPKYSLSYALRNKLGPLPISSAAIKEADGQWEAAKYRLPVKANFMLAFTCEFTSWLTGYDMLRARNKVSNFSEAPSLRSPPATVLSPELLSAFPDANTRKWLTVKGILDGYEADPTGGNKSRITVKGAIEHNVNFFIWRPEAKKDLQNLASSGWLLKVGGLPKYYPFDIHKKLEAAPQGHKITLVGRFLRNPLGHPRNWFEIWDLKIGFSPAQEEMYSALREPVEISFPSLEIRKLGSFLRWFGIRVALKGITGDSRLSFQAKGCTIGRLIDKIARTLDSNWYWEKGTVVFSRKISRRQSEDVKLVLSRLRNEDRGKLLVFSGSQPASRPSPAQPATLPADAVSLENLANKALLSMDYTLAGNCYKKLEALPDALSRKKQLRRQRYRIALMHEMTRQTPVSHLVSASDLFEINYRNSAGELLKRTVRILRRDKEHVWIQSSYGEQARLRRAGIQGEKAISHEQWLGSKQEELRQRNSQLDKTGQYGYLSDLFSLALFAKTNRLNTEGTKFLDRAFASDNFGWLLGTYFPDDVERLTRYWRRGSGRADPLAKIASPEKNPRKKPAVPSRLKPVKELARNTPLPREPKTLLDYGIRHYRKGREYLARSLPGMDGALTNKKLALDHFELARNASQQLLKLNPKNANASDLAKSSILMVHTCAKDVGFFD